MNAENLTDCILKAGDKISHFHVSFPNLTPVTGGTIDFSLIDSLLREVGYDGAISVEMRPTTEANVEAALQILKNNFR